MIIDLEVERRDFRVYLIQYPNFTDVNDETQGRCSFHKILGTTAAVEARCFDYRVSILSTTPHDVHLHSKGLA